MEGIMRKVNKLVIDRESGYWLYRYIAGVLDQTIWLGLSKADAIFYLYQLKGFKGAVI